MTDFQLFQDKNKSLPYLSRWSRREVNHPSRDLGNTDHWAKMKHKAMSFEVYGNNFKSHRFPGEPLQHETRSKHNPLLTHRHEIGGYLCNIGVKSFSDWMVEELNGNIPGFYYKTRQPNPKVLRTAANERARDNFRYWFLDKKPSTRPRKLVLPNNFQGLRHKVNSFLIGFGFGVLLP